MAKARHTRFDCSPGCAVEATLSLIDGKWKGVILYHLLDETLRIISSMKPSGSMNCGGACPVSPNAC